MEYITSFSDLKPLQSSREQHYRPLRGDALEAAPSHRSVVGTRTKLLGIKT